MAEIQLKHVYKKYEDKVVAVQDFNLKIKDQEFVIFVGPSGCGKSTTLRRIGGNIRRGASDRWKNDESGTVMRQRYCNGVSELCTVPAYDRI